MSAQYDATVRGCVCVMLTISMTFVIAYVVQSYELPLFQISFLFDGFTIERRTSQAIAYKTTQTVASGTRSTLSQTAMTRDASSIFSPTKHVLSREQKHMYASERNPNFRVLAKLFASRSPYTLTTSDLASPTLIEALFKYGHYAQTAYSIIDPKYVFENVESLVRPDYPFEGCEDLIGTVLISAFKSSAAALEGIVCYRPSSKELVIAISGTKTFMQAIYDMMAWKHPHPVGHGCAVHAGVWKMHDGYRHKIFQAIHKGLQEYEVTGVVTTGHSIGGAMSQLLAFDLLSEEVIPPGLTLKVTGFGGPRVGNAELAARWRHLVSAYEGTVEEYIVKAYNDGVSCGQSVPKPTTNRIPGIPSLPLMSIGYRHMSQKQLYWYHGRLFHIPPGESEHGLFNVSRDALDATKIPEHPRGGHNYYER